jgi:hypothetical protein
MFPTISRKRLTVATIGVFVTAALCGAAAVAVWGVGGTAPPSTGAAAAAGPTTQPAAPRARAAHRTVIGRLVSTEPGSITLADATGHTSTYTVGSRTKVLGPDHQPESLSAIPTGELVVVTVSSRGAGPSKGRSHPAPTPASSGDTVPAGGPTAAVAVEDTGFAAR